MPEAPGLCFPSQIPEEFLRLVLFYGLLYIQDFHLDSLAAELDFQKSLLGGELPYTVGGGIGQSRICMFYLRKAHIGEVQSSIWPNEVVEEAAVNGIPLL